ncbi:hypothetical protein L3Y21_gp008 [Gordonia phage Rabbitrun]|uniref:Uncharacterized protein n=1 Tax=Gordonia phage Rabbitrun TaxID=2762280 RepID=A0A7G8LII0_9CAUD|nr:hypothetical protein L3Y21_gp008 [Gordonia phage Rabbitrun]QNJ57052.1 hypothetical protein SEA_RABBITRUN_8 [Gordonia phage Rabbitrun]
MEYTYGRQARNVAHLNDQTPWHFGIHNTGGGCMALQANLNKNYEVLVTHRDGEILPDHRYDSDELDSADFFGILVGIYDIRNGDTVATGEAMPSGPNPVDEVDAISLALARAIHAFKTEPLIPTDLDLSSIVTVV